jgi:hypothetical protein
MVARIASCAGYIAMTVSPLRLAPAALVLMLAGTALAQSAPMNLAVDTMQRVAVRGSISSVIVGNPLIADVTVVDANTLYVTGKGYGVTEIVAVDTAGRTVFQSEVVVTAGSGSGRVRVWRGGQATEMACAASCSPSLRGTSGAAPKRPEDDGPHGIPKAKLPHPVRAALSAVAGARRFGGGRVWHGRPAVPAS